MTLGKKSSDIIIFFTMKKIYINLSEPYEMSDRGLKRIFETKVVVEDKKCNFMMIKSLEFGHD